MNGKLHLLQQDMEAELDAIERIFAALHQSDTDLDETRNTIVVAYYLHNLYNAFENLFRLVAATFENHIPDPSRWHTLLLSRMGRDIREHPSAPDWRDDCRAPRRTAPFSPRFPARVLL